MADALVIHKGYSFWLFVHVIHDGWLFKFIGQLEGLLSLGKEGSIIVVVD